MLKKKCIAMLLAGGQGSRLGLLTKVVAKPAVPFGGKYRIIDFPLSNCSNSGIDVVGVLTQYQPLELNRYIGAGQPWDLDLMNGGVYVLPPYMKGKSGEWYKGTANSIFQNIAFIEQYDPDYVLVLSGDHIYKMDYRLMLNDHIEHRADVTIAVRPVPWEEAPAFGIMSVDGENRITEFEEKPARPKSNLASMGVYVFSWPVLKKYLTEDDADPDSKNDFGKNIIPENSGRRAAAAGLFLRSLLEGRGHHRQPLGGEHGSDFLSAQVRPAGFPLAHLRPVAQDAGAVRGLRGGDSALQHHRGLRNLRHGAAFGDLRRRDH